MISDSEHYEESPISFVDTAYCPVSMMSEHLDM